jgi:hypothetical protein
MWIIAVILALVGRVTPMNYDADMPVYICTEPRQDVSIHYYSFGTSIPLLSPIVQVSTQTHCIEACQPCVRGIGYQIFCHPTKHQQDTYGLFPYRDDMEGTVYDFIKPNGLTYRGRRYPPGLTDHTGIFMSYPDHPFIYKYVQCVQYPLRHSLYQQLRARHIKLKLKRRFKKLKSRLRQFNHFFSYLHESIEKPHVESTDEPIEKPHGEPIEKPHVESTDEPIEKPYGEPIEKPHGEPIEKSHGEPIDEPIDKTHGDPIEKPHGDSFEKPQGEPIEKSVVESTDEPIQNTTENPTRTPTVDPTDEPIQNPTRTPTVDPTDEPIQNPTRTPTVDPTDEPIQNPTENPTRTPTVEPTDKPTRTPTVEPSENPTRTPTVEPSENPTRTPTVEPY